MRKITATTLFAMAATSLIAADGKADVEAAAKKLSDKPSYSWVATTESQSRFGDGDRDGKTEKGGYTILNMPGRDNQQIQAVFKGDKGVIKAGESWHTLQALADSEDEETRRLRFTARRLQQFKPPHGEAQDLLKHAKAIEKDEDGIYVGQLSPEGLKAIYGRGFRRGGDSAGEGVDVSGLSGRVKFWLKDGAISKYSRHVEGNMKFGDRDVEVDTTTTTQIKEVGSTKVIVPDEAKKKLAS
jgi:hypothetical protein